MTVTEIREALIPVANENADYEARLLFSFYSGLSFSQILAENPDFSSRDLESALKRRLENEPLAYILGYTEFYGERYAVSPDCLIPRSDTEIIVEYAIKNLPKNAFFIDLCTGSGCIAISILAHRKDCRAIALDISLGALSIAKENAISNGVSDRIEFVLCDILSESISCEALDAVISNPPYIRSDVIETLSSDVRREPIIALDGGEDGMKFYRRIVKEYESKLKDSGFFLFETGYDQKNDIISLAEQQGYLCECINDYGKNHRGAILKKPNR